MWNQVYQQEIGHINSSSKCKMCETKFKYELYLFLKRRNPLNVKNAKLNF